jgi:CMP-N,N'-diacetyllegionaminic acid synthase
MDVLGIIPARSGSKGIKQKNIQKLDGKPLIQYSIEQALDSKISKLVVNTDDPKIALLSKSLGAEIPFLRPKKLAGDKTTTYDVIENTISHFKKISYFPDIVVILQPTTPFRPKDIINDSISLLQTEKASSVLAVRSTKDHSDIILKKPHKFLKTTSNNFFKKSRRQDRSSLFVPSGLIYTFWTKNLEKYGNLYGPNIFPYISNDNFNNIDIDIPFDFFIAEMVAKYWKKYKNKWI